MKKADLKKAIKPLVKECIQEVLIEEGLLSNIVSEVAIGLQTNNIVEHKNKEPNSPHTQQRLRAENNANKLNQQKRKMLDAIGKDAYNGVDLFEGTTPAPAQQQAPAPGSVDLGNPNDAGVDISSIMGGASKIWGAMK